ncbi:hypothetical protein [Streptomyces microflavus]|uniref:hypothetical protein n=1 Tax=Streptomyces microflavus TaxID=1919 RepID=UPI003B211DE8
MGTVVFTGKGDHPGPDHHPNQEAAMGHAVMTHVPTRATTNYNNLPTFVQEVFDDYMEQADNARTNDDYRKVMAFAAFTIAVPLPAGGEIALCACPNCWNCGRIFDANDPDAHPFGQSTGYNLGRIQCPDCTDAHRATDEQ